MGPRDSLDILEKKKVPFPIGILTRSLLAIRTTLLNAVTKEISFNQFTLFIQCIKFFHIFPIVTGAIEINYK